MPREFYEVPGSAPALFSTNRSTLPKRQLQEPLPPRIARSCINIDLALKINYYWTTFPDLMGYVRTPENWSDLYQYFDAVDLWTQGPDFLFYLLNTISNINQTREIEIFQECEQEIKKWAAEWVAANRDLLLTVPSNHSLLQFLTQEEYEGLEGLTNAQHATLAIALQNEHYELLRCFRCVPPEPFILQFTTEPREPREPQSWVGGRQTHFHQHGPPIGNIHLQSDLRRYSVQNPKRTATQQSSQPPYQHSSKMQTEINKPQLNYGSQKPDSRRPILPQSARGNLRYNTMPLVQSESRRYTGQHRYSSAPQPSLDNNELKPVSKIVGEPIYFHNSHQISPPRLSPSRVSPPRDKISAYASQVRSCQPKQLRDGPNSVSPYKQISYADEKAFRRVLDGFQSSERHGNAVTYFYEDPRSPTPADKARTAYVGSVDEVNFTSHELKELMSNCGTVERIKYLLPCGNFLGSAFVTFKENEAVNRAIARYDSYQMMLGARSHIRVDFVKHRNRSGSQNTPYYTSPNGSLDPTASRRKEKLPPSHHRSASKPLFPLQQIDESQSVQSAGLLPSYPSVPTIEQRLHVQNVPLQPSEVVEKTPVMSDLPQMGPVQINASILSATLSDIVRYQSAFHRLDQQRLHDEHYHYTHETVHSNSVGSLIRKENSQAKQKSIDGITNESPKHSQGEKHQSDSLRSKGRNNSSKKFKNKKNYRKPLSDIFPREFHISNPNLSDLDGDIVEGLLMKTEPSPQVDIATHATPIVNLPARNPELNSKAMMSVSKLQTGKENSKIEAVDSTMHKQDLNSNTNNLNRGTDMQVDIACSEEPAVLWIGKHEGDNSKKTRGDKVYVPPLPVSDNASINQLPVSGELRKQKQKYNKKKQKHQDSGNGSVGDTSPIIPGTSDQKVSTSDILTQKKGFNSRQAKLNMTVTNAEEIAPATQRTMSTISLPANNAPKEEPRHQQTRSLADLSLDTVQKSTKKERKDINTKLPAKSAAIKTHTGGLRDQNSCSTDTLLEEHTNKDGVGSPKMSLVGYSTPNNSDTSSFTEQTFKQEQKSGNRVKRMELALTDESQWPALGSAKAPAKHATNRRQPPTPPVPRVSGSSNVRSTKKHK
ncbi:hypothetical protein B7463_g3724, partial [Scytalidium lignicola]